MSRLSGLWGTYTLVNRTFGGRGGISGILSHLGHSWSLVCELGAGGNIVTGDDKEADPGSQFFCPLPPLSSNPALLNLGSREAQWKFLNADAWAPAPRKFDLTVVFHSGERQGHCLLKLLAGDSNVQLGVKTPSSWNLRTGGWILSLGRK